MKKLTRILVPLFVLLLAVLALAACGGQTEPVSDPGEIPKESPPFTSTLDKDGNVTITGIENSKDQDVVIPAEIGGHPVTKIDSYAFRGCKSLVTVEIPASVKYIGSGAFFECGSLVSVTFAKNSKLTSISSSTFTNCQSLKKIEIPAGVKSIGDDAFRLCTALTSVTIPSSVTSIGDYVFYGCTSLSNVDISENVTSIGEFAFSNCPNLQYHVYDNALYLGSSKVPFAILIKATGTEITSCNIHSTTRYICKKAFYDCSLLASVIFLGSSQLKSIEGLAFAYCKSLFCIDIPAGVKYIGESAFYNCSDLVNVRFREKSRTESIGDHCFRGCTALTNVEIPASVSSIGEAAFYQCSSLTSVKIAADSKLTSIGSYAFSECKLLKNITYGNTMAQWFKITKMLYWNLMTGNYTVDCSDGILTKAES